MGVGVGKTAPNRPHMGHRRLRIRSPIAQRPICVPFVIESVLDLVGIDPKGGLSLLLVVLGYIWPLLAHSLRRSRTRALAAPAVYPGQLPRPFAT